MGFRAKNEVQRRVVSEQFMGCVDFAMGSEERDWSVRRRKQNDEICENFMIFGGCFFLNFWKLFFDD